MQAHANQDAGRPEAVPRTSPPEERRSGEGAQSALERLRRQERARAESRGRPERERAR